MNATNDKRNETLENSPTFPRINAKSQLDVIYEVTAPENVAFQYCVAGPFSRAAAYTGDLAVMGVYLATSTIGAVCFLEYLLGDEGIFASLPKLRDILFFSFYFVNTMFVAWFWSALFEAFWQGRTPGKALVGLRVISCSGRPLRLSQAFIRNVLRLADLASGPFIVPIMGSNARMARLGDVAADTIVVVSGREAKKSRRDGKDGSLVKEPFDEKLLANVAAKIPEDFLINDSLRKALDLYVSRRADLAPTRRMEVAKTLADVLQDRMKISPRLNPDVFLYALYKISLGMNRETF